MTDRDPLRLTFDDGPDPAGTPPLLDALAAAGATATFFPLAPRAEQQPELIARMLAEGHTVGLHCDEHVRHSDRDASWVAADTSRGLRRLAGLGVRPDLWRTPWGDTASFTERVADAHGLTLTGWTVDTHDWRGDEAAEMFAATRNVLRPGAIVLAHDGIGPGARRADIGETIDYIGLVVRWAAHNDVALRAL